MDKLSLAILGYLLDHPEASDTAEGIVAWWLLEREIRDQRSNVARVLPALVAEGWILASQAADARLRYRVNPRRLEEIRTLIERRVP